jgi:plastocyanin
MRESRLPVLLLLATGLLLAACSGATSSSSPATSAAASPAASTPASAAPSESAAASSSAAASAEPSSAAAATLTVTGKEYAFDLPASVPAGVTAITLTNAGKEEHQAQLVKINTGKTMTDLLGALQDPNPAAALQLVTLSGGPTGVQPGASGTATVSLEPGAYAFLCFISAPDGTPHLAKGMVAPLEVTGTAASTEIPAGDTSLTVKDFSFDLSSLGAGKHTVTVKNDGPQPHEATIVKLSAGMTVDTILGMLSASPAPGESPPSGPPPWTDVGGISAIAPGTTASMDVDLPAGDYAFICFVPDPATGKSHVELGMIGPLTVQ